MHGCRCSFIKVCDELLQPLICLVYTLNSSSSMELFRSRDEGQTFDSVGYLWRRSPGQWLQGGASSLLQLASGRLLVPFHYGMGWQGSQHNRVSCMLSASASTAPTTIFVDSFKRFCLFLS